MNENKMSPAGEVAGASFQREPNPPHRILVVDDEPDLRRLNAKVLESSGYKVDTATDGQAGWEALRAARHAPESYALLITDHNMPGLTGLALIKRLRAARMALPVIMATGTLPAEELFARYDWLKPVVTLTKPYSIEQLLGTVKMVLRTADGTREHTAPPNWRSQPPVDDLRL